MSRPPVMATASGTADCARPTRGRTARRASRTKKRQTLCNNSSMPSTPSTHPPIYPPTQSVRPLHCTPFISIPLRCIALSFIQCSAYREQFVR